MQHLQNKLFAPLRLSDCSTCDRGISPRQINVYSSISRTYVLTGRDSHPVGDPKECTFSKTLEVNKLSQKDTTYWYALRVTYSREIALKTLLDKNNIENFIPMHYKVVTKNGRRVRKLVPVVNNLVFIRSTRRKIDEIKEKNALTLPLRYIMNRETKAPITIPEVQMQHFIAVSGNYDQQLVYLPATQSTIQKGDRVRITGGVFEGVEGMFIRIKGDRRVVVSIQGVMAVATAFVHPSLIERVEDIKN